MKVRDYERLVKTLVCLVLTALFVFLFLIYLPRFVNLDKDFKNYLNQMLEFKNFGGWVLTISLSFLLSILALELIFMPLWRFGRRKIKFRKNNKEKAFQ